jgi:hypothetical protein
MRRAMIAAVLKCLVGLPHRFGLPRPDHKLFETHPIINSLLVYYVSHGAITPKPDILRLEDAQVYFEDGTCETIDLIVYATGYNLVFPFIDRTLLNWQDGRPRLYLNVFHPHYDNLFVAGMIQPDSGQFGLVDWQARAIVAFLTALRDGSPAAEKLRQRTRQPQETFGSGIRYKNCSRHHLQVEHWSYRLALEALVHELSLRRAG